MVQNINSSTFDQKTRFTKKGNHYQKTNVFTLGGLAAGAAVGVAKNTKAIINSKGIIEQAKSMLPAVDVELQKIIRLASSNADGLDDFFKSPMYKKMINSIPRNGFIAVVGLSIAGAAIAGLAIGAIANGIANKIRSINADKQSQGEISSPAIQDAPKRTTTLNIKPPF